MKDEGSGSGWIRGVSPDLWHKVPGEVTLEGGATRKGRSATGLGSASVKSKNSSYTIPNDFTSPLRSSRDPIRRLPTPSLAGYSLTGQIIEQAAGGVNMFPYVSVIKTVQWRSQMVDSYTLHFGGKGGLHGL